MTSVHISQHALAPTSLSPSAAEELRRFSRQKKKNEEASSSRPSSSRSRSSSPPSLVRFHYEVGVVDSKAGVLNLIQVCCEVCVEGKDCCKTNVCCDAVCCQLHLPSSSSSATKTQTVTASEHSSPRSSSEVQLPRVVATSPSSHAGLSAYPITARELMAHVARCCTICIESKGGECCKKDCCAISCCLVNVDLVDSKSSQISPRTKTVSLIDEAAAIEDEDEDCSAPPPLEGFRMSTPFEELTVNAKPKSCGSKSKCCASKAGEKQESPRATTPRRCTDKVAEDLKIELPEAIPLKEKCCSKKKCSSGTDKLQQPQQPSCDPPKEKCCSKKQCGDAKPSDASLVDVHSDKPAVTLCTERSSCGGDDVELAKVAFNNSCATSKCCSTESKMTDLASADDAVSSSTAISVSPATMLRMSFQVSGMDCASCSKMVEDRVKRLENVRTATCSVMTGHTDIAYELNDNYSALSAEKATEHSEMVIQEITKTIEAMGFKSDLLRFSVVTPDSNNGAEMDEATVPTVRLTLAIQEIAGADRNTLSSTCTKLLQFPGVKSASVRSSSKLKDNPASSLLLFEYQPDVIGARSIVKKVEQLLGDQSLLTVVSSDDSATDSAGENDLATFWRRRFLTCLIFVIPLFVITYFLPAAGSDSSTMRAMHHEITSGLRVSSLIGFLLALPIQVYGGMPLYLSAYRAARFGRKLNIDALVALSTTVAFVYSVATTIACMAGQSLLDDVFFETSAVVLTVILLGRYLESIAKGKAAAALSELARMQVDTAMLVNEQDNEGQVDFNKQSGVSSQEIHTDLLQRDDIVQVLPGARFPTDGLVVFGSSTVDEAMLTGEARPVSKSLGDRVFGSTVNQRGMLRIRVTRVPGENALSGIMQLVRQAQNSNPPIQRVADAVAAYFVPVILGLAVSVFVLWLILAETGVVTTDLASVTFALKFAIATLVVSCPCAVGLAVPVPVMVASGVGAKLGVLFKSGPALEALHKATAIVFDKTGTLTLGKPSVVQWKNLKNDTIADKLFWWTVASAESGSEHVWAKAVLDYARADVELEPLSTPSGFEAVSGRGIRCAVNGEPVLIGNKRWMEDNEISVDEAASPVVEAANPCGDSECGKPSAECCPPGLESVVKKEQDEDIVRLQSQGASVVYVSIGGKLAGWIALSDPIRPEASEVIKALEAMNVQVWVLSGDAQSSTDVVAKALGIDSRRAIGNLLPGDKAKRVQDLQANGKLRIAMIGDGINDAPALTQADIGLTVANGSDVAMGAADVVLMKDHLSLLLHAVELSRATFKVIKLNLAWAFFYNLLAIPFAVGAFYTLDNVVLPPTFAGLAELLSSLPVILFAIALKWFKPSVGAQQCQ